MGFYFPPQRPIYDMKCFTFVELLAKKMNMLRTPEQLLLCKRSSYLLYPASLELGHGSLLFYLLASVHDLAKNSGLITFISI